MLIYSVPVLKGSNKKSEESNADDDNKQEDSDTS